MKKINLPIALALALPFISCTEGPRSFEKIQQDGNIYFAIRNSPTTYYKDRSGETVGFEFELAKRFAKENGLKANFVIADSISDVLEKIKLGKADIAAAGLSKTKKRQEDYLFGPSYQEVKEMVVCRDGVIPLAIKTLNKYDLKVEKNTSYHESLKEINEKEEIKYQVTTDENTFELLHLVGKEKLDCTIADSIIVELYRKYFPNLNTPFSLGEAKSLAWVVHENNASLQSAIEDWFDNSLGESQLNVLKDRYFGHTGEYDRFDTVKFLERVETRLPKYKGLFKDAAQKTGWPWTLLAVISYQESHWRESAKSATGVRGLMMLTNATAKEMGVKDRTDPKQSVMGGAKYLRKLEKRVPKYIPDPDRLWMALASYNVGFSHLRDARGVAAWIQENPNRWAGLKEALPLLAKKKYYRRLPSGYARGWEPVIYVTRIRNYHKLLLSKLNE